ncbi:MAG: DUF3883 domain-containing protein [Anaerolineales bacterium]
MANNDNTQIMGNSWVPQTSTEWFDWLSAEEAKTSNSYLAKPSTLIASYRNEIATARDYEGREILELLQNTADQAREANLRGQVVIELLPEGLVIANNGTAFSVGGVLSLENAYLSPKRHKRRQFIGNKGLGFRSILNWTHAPIILSGELGLAYSQMVSQEKLDELLAESPELNDLVTEERGEGDTLVIPVLPFPGYSQHDDIGIFIEDKAVQQLHDRCLKWREEGYTTAIGMPFEEPVFFDHAHEQIKALRPEILLFVDHLDEVRFSLPEEEERIWSLEGDDLASMVMENEEPLGIWQVHRTQGEVPEDKLDKDQKSPLSYELIVAVPEVEALEELHVSPLFSYFPTTVTLPLPVVCHATLELDQSRNHIQQRRSNRYVFERLAGFLAEVAEIRAVQYPTGPKAGFRMLMALETYPNDIKREEFSEYLIEAAAQRAIVPTMGGRAVLAEQSLYLSGADDSWLPVSSFREIVPVSCSQEQDFFEEIGVKELEKKELRKRLLVIEGLSREQRANLIVGMIQNHIPTEVHSSALLLDSNAQPIPDGAVVFIAPQGGTVPALPSWVTLWFLDESLRLQLMARLNVKEIRELQSKLADFGLREYSLARLISRLVTAANQRKKDQPESIESINHELLRTVFALYQAEGQSGNLPAFPEKTSIPLPTQAGSNVAAKTLYLGRGYGVQGTIVQALYGRWARNKLVVEPEGLGLLDMGIELPKFLEWLGAARWPREKTLSSSGRDYLNHVLERIRYPAKFEEYIFDSRSDVKQAFVDEVKTVDGLEDILGRADPLAITAWLALDVRALEWSRRNTNSANLTALRGQDYKRRSYEGTVPSYVRWKLETMEWLLKKDRQRLRPKDCVLGERAIEVLFPRPARPDRKALEPYGINDVDLLEGWRRSGVITSLAELELDDIYARLLELPERQPKGKSARSLYRWLLDATDSALGEGGGARERFFLEGRMWGHRGDKAGYFPVSELHHADSDGLPAALLDRLKIVDLPHRVGADKVKRVFGVEPIERVAIKQKVKRHRLATDLDSDFQQAKPFLFLLRESQSSHTQHLGTLKRLSLKVCSELCAEMEYGGDKFDFELPVWGWLIDEGVLYIRSDPVELVDSSSDLLADAIGVAIASVFRIGNGGEYARMFLCRQKDRKALLRRMRGEAADEDMDRIIEEFGQKTEENRLAMLPEVGPIEEPESDSSKDTDADLNEATNNEVKPDQPDTEAHPKLPEPLYVEQVEHHPQPAPTTQKMRIKRKSGKPSSHTTTYQVTDPDFVEQKIMEIEASFQPPRYPLRVGQLMGSDAPGCDILSFDSSEHRDMFQSGEDRDMGRVRRFIEVKGRKHKGAEIELRGNEKDAAVKYGARYYLYRLFKSGESDYTLSILKNPLSSEEALEASVYVHLNRAKHMEEYEISGGILPKKS